jgi:hypothetical protein
MAERSGRRERRPKRRKPGNRAGFVPVLGEYVTVVLRIAAALAALFSVLGGCGPR